MKRKPALLCFIKISLIFSFSLVAFFIIYCFIPFLLCFFPTVKVDLWLQTISCAQASVIISFFGFVSSSSFESYWIDVAKHQIIAGLLESQKKCKNSSLHWKQKSKEQHQVILACGLYLDNLGTCNPWKRKSLSKLFLQSSETGEI